MRANEFTTDAPGELLELGANAGVAFEPYPLPPKLNIDAELARMIGATERILGRLDGRGHGLTNPYILVQPFLRREALASSRIEGTTAVIEDVLRFEAGEPQTKNPDDVQEVINYLNALRYGLMRPEERPFSLGFLNELHQLLLDDVRGQDRHPGALRKIQVVIGRPGSDIATARFVPPPPTIIQGLLDQLIEWLAVEDDYPELIRLALLHYQFETIHPYEDGNGRLGRLLITLMLKEWGIMEFPLLYLSEYFEQNKPQYLDHLLAVSQRGAWNEWIKFFLGAVQNQASDALQASTRLIELRETYKGRYQQGRPQAHILNVIDQLFENVVVAVSRLSDHFDVRQEQIQRAINTLVEDGLIRELTGKRRDRLYASPEILSVLHQRSQ
jgi:Fic family protein